MTLMTENYFYKKKSNEVGNPTNHVLWLKIFGNALSRNYFLFYSVFTYGSCWCLIERLLHNFSQL